MLLPRHQSKPKHRLRRSTSRSRLASHSYSFDTAILIAFDTILGTELQFKKSLACEFESNPAPAARLSWLWEYKRKQRKIPKKEREKEKKEGFPSLLNTSYL